MKRFIVPLALLLATSAFAMTYDSGAFSPFNTGQFRLTNAGNDIFTATSTAMLTNQSGETRAFLLDATYAGTSGTELPSTLWSFMHYNQSGAVTTAHGGALFGRAIAATTAQGFHFGVEGNDWNNSTQATGNGVGVIGHAVWEGAATSTPTATTIGVNSRSEITDPTITTNRNGITTADVVAYRAETYGGQSGGSGVVWNSRNYNFFGAVGGSAAGKILNNGPIMAIAVSAQTIASGDTIFSDGCGTVKQISAGSAVNTSASITFSTPSVLTDGTANTGCVMTVVNVGANTITLKNNATSLMYGGIDVALPSAAAVQFVSNGSNWVQSSRVVVTTLAGVYLSSATSAANTAANTVWGNHGTVTLLPGDWDVTGVCDISLNGSVTTAVSMALSANSGNTTTDQVSGDNQLTLLPPTAAADVSATIGEWRQAVAVNTPVYVKVKATFSPGNPQAACRISARRIN